MKLTSIVYSYSLIDYLQQLVVERYYQYLYDTNVIFDTPAI